MTKQKNDKKSKQVRTYKKKESGKNETGRPTEYKEDYCQLMIDYFMQGKISIDGDRSGGEEKKKNTALMFPSDIRFAQKIGVNRDTLYERAKVHKQFSDSMKECNLIQEAILLENGLNNSFNATFTMFLLKNRFNYKDKSEVDHKIVTVSEEDLED